MTSTHPKTDLERAAGDGVVKSPVEARQAIKTHHVRWMLVVSLALAVVAVGAVWVTSAATHHSQTPAPIAASAQS